MKAGHCIDSSSNRSSSLLGILRPLDDKPLPLGWGPRSSPSIMALNFITAVLVLVTTLLADLAYGLVDPRVAYDR